MIAVFYLFALTSASVYNSEFNHSSENGPDLIACQRNKGTDNLERIVKDFHMKEAENTIQAIRTLSARDLHNSLEYARITSMAASGDYPQRNPKQTGTLRKV